MTRDITYMRRALELAERGLGHTSPNPLVGAVIVRDGSVIAEGWHAAYGQAHAEAMALSGAGERASGATLYCTLEPCCHRTPEKQTPPCTERIIAAGIHRVVFAVYDPNPHVAGHGEQALTAAGIEVETAVLAEEAARINEPFFAWIQRKTPYVHLKIAQTLDGKIAARDGSSNWISGPDSREEVHRMRLRYDAVLVGAGTVATDDPSLTVRHVSGRQPVRVVLDTSLRTLGSAKLYSDGAAPTIVVCSREAAEAVSGRALFDGVTLVPCRSTVAGKLELEAVLELLAERRIASVLVEGGAMVATSFLRKGLVDRLTVFVNPSIMGEGVSWAGDVGVASAGERISLSHVEMLRYGADIAVSGLPNAARTYGTVKVAADRGTAEGA